MNDNKVDPFFDWEAGKTYIMESGSVVEVICYEPVELVRVKYEHVPPIFAIIPDGTMVMVFKCEGYEMFYPDWTFPPDTSITDGMADSMDIDNE